jgi:hypothetical protein
VKKYIFILSATLLTMSSAEADWYKFALYHNNDNEPSVLRITELKEPLQESISKCLRSVKTNAILVKSGADVGFEIACGETDAVFSDTYKNEVLNGPILYLSFDKNNKVTIFKEDSLAYCLAGAEREVSVTNNRAWCGQSMRPLMVDSFDSKVSYDEPFKTSQDLQYELESEGH